MEVRVALTPSDLTRFRILRVTKISSCVIAVMGAVAFFAGHATAAACLCVLLFAIDIFNFYPNRHAKTIRAQADVTLIHTAILASNYWMASRIGWTHGMYWMCVDAVVEFLLAHELEYMLRKRNARPPERQ